MRAIFQGIPDAVIGTTTSLRVELIRPGLSTLFDERSISIVDTPPVRHADSRVTLPPFRLIPINGPEDQTWAALGWSDNIRTVASSAEMESGELVIYYSTVFPKYAGQREIFAQRDPVLANSFTSRYEIWLAVHSLLFYRDQHESETNTASLHLSDEGMEAAEQREMEERCRIATMATLVAAREVQSSLEAIDIE
jgi:hypothetical protein